MSRYERNHPAISEAEQSVLASKRVFIAGCGGLGCYIAELLTRAGVGALTIADGDSYSESNLNRQLFSASSTLGQNKPAAAAMRLRDVNPDTEITPVCDFITYENAAALIAGHDLIIDALDNAEARLLLARSAQKAGLCLVTGAISGWQGRVTVISPEDTETAEFLWGTPVEAASAGNLGCTAAVIASVEAAEALKELISRGAALRGRILEIDLLENEWETIELR